MAISPGRCGPMNCDLCPLARNYDSRSTSDSLNCGRNYVPRFNKYKASSSFSAGFDLVSVLVSPPQTINTLLTSALAWPTRGDGMSPALCIKVADKSRVENRYRSLRAVSLTSPPKRYRSPLGVEVAGRACPYRGNGHGEGEVGGTTPGLLMTTGGGSRRRRADHGYAGRGAVEFCVGGACVDCD